MKQILKTRTLKSWKSKSLGKNVSNVRQDIKETEDNSVTVEYLTMLEDSSAGMIRATNEEATKAWMDRFSLEIELITTHSNRDLAYAQNNADLYRSKYDTLKENLRNLGGGREPDSWDWF